MTPKYQRVSFLANLTITLLKVCYRIFESACSTFCSFFVSEKSVRDEIVLITGAGHGMGRELAIQYARLGATVVCLDINQQTNESTANEIAKTIGTPVYSYRCDITDKIRVSEVAKEVRKVVGVVTILINNAGILYCRSFMNLTAEQIRNEFDVNILSQFWMIQAFLPGMMERNHGHIVSLSSMAGLTGMPYLTSYSATKFAVQGFMQALEEELRLSTDGKSLIKFTTIFPYIVDTGLCKKPQIKYLELMPLISPKNAVAKIISAQRQGISGRSIPVYWYSASKMCDLLPKSVQVLLRELVHAVLEPTD